MLIWKNLFIVPLLALLSASILVFTGCDGGDSGETAYRQVPLKVTGFYRPVDGNEVIVAGNSGAAVTVLDLRQSGDRLEAVDNNGIIFKGTIGGASDTEATITLKGRTTTGAEVTISGYISVGVGSSTGEMRGTWIEPTLYAGLAAVASVPENNPSEPDDDDDGDNGTFSISAARQTLLTNGETTTITATGIPSGSSVTWTSESNGTVSPTTGTQVNYTRTGAGNNRVTATAGSASDSVTITQP